MGPSTESAWVDGWGNSLLQQLSAFVLISFKGFLGKPWFKFL